MTPRIKSMIWNIRKQKATNQNKKKKDAPKCEDKYKQPLGQCQAFQHSHHRGTRNRFSKIENLFEKIMKENYPNLVKEIDMQVQEAYRGPNKMDTKRPTPRHIIIKMPKVKDKERILKAARGKQVITYGEFP